MYQPNDADEINKDISGAIARREKLPTGGVLVQADFDAVTFAYERLGLIRVTNELVEAPPSKYGVSVNALQLLDQRGPTKVWKSCWTPTVRGRNALVLSKLPEAISAAI